MTTTKEAAPAEAGPILRPVQQALAAVMADVQAVGKTGRNTQQNYSFRGIDAVVNAVGPILRKHGVLVLPRLRSYEYGTVEVGAKRTPMGHVRVEVEYVFVGPEGDQLPTVAPGEAMDSGDKATPKAMSVAFRTALLQALALPTDEPDPDEQTYERPTPPTARELVQAAQKAADLDELGGIAQLAVQHLDEAGQTAVRQAYAARRDVLLAAQGQGGDAK